jgi:hypothetical protein
LRVKRIVSGGQIELIEPLSIGRSAEELRTVDGAGSEDAPSIRSRIWRAVNCHVSRSYTVHKVDVETLRQSRRVSFE